MVQPATLHSLRAVVRHRLPITPQGCRPFGCGEHPVCSAVDRCGPACALQPDSLGWDLSWPENQQSSSIATLVRRLSTLGQAKADANMGGMCSSEDVPEIIAAVRNDDEEGVKALLSSGSDVNAADEVRTAAHGPSRPPGTDLSLNALPGPMDCFARCLRVPWALS